ncbi:MAG TPA: glycoside hydrolase family 3 N-terminal domain-containing protein [Anaerolineaceae bacterium]
MMRKLLLFFLLTMLLAAAALPVCGIQAVQAQQAVDPAVKSKALLAQLTPEEKVGQLFVATFKGRDVTSKDAKIMDMVTNHYLGGVILRAANDNFTGPAGTLDDLSKLTTNLQTDKYQGSQKPAINPVNKLQFVPKFIPLLIGISQEGDLYPFDQIINGVTPLPDLMAIGSTWKTQLAERVGATLGSELQALGINLLVGPSQDVLDTINKDNSGDLGTRTFGGDPFWVGEMGQAYIRGLHQGSNKRLAVIATHFPGSGNADRSMEEDVATVKKSLEQLKQIELAPFFAITGNASSPDSATDGLLVSHIRYQGFQGNIRDTTRPVSFDQTALDQILSLPALTSWRQAGGILMSDNLGSPGIRKFFDPSGTSFDARQIALNAFLAGNDLLYLDNFVSLSDSDPFTTLQRTLDLFAQKYREDTAFAQRVDASVIRILTVKYRLFPDFTLSNVLPAADGLAQVGKGQQVTFDVAQQAVTLLSPSQAELSQVLPRPPVLRERIVFITDIMSARQCSTCSNQPVLAVDAMQTAILRLYGPQAGGQVQAGNLSSYSFLDLKNFMDNGKDTPQHLVDDLSGADWVVVAALNIQAARPESVAFQRMLSERPDLIRNKRVVLFAFNAPYYLDATDISKLTAYYALYSKSPAFVEVAAKILFRELTPAGFLPVSVPGAGYDLSVATSPDPAQVISLELDLPPPAAPLPQLTQTFRPSTSPTATVAPKFRVGDNLPLRTGIILDHNKNPVPDGTVVRFLFTIGSSDSSTQSEIDTTTTGGVAHAAFRIPSAGLLQIQVVSEPANSSKLLRLDISSTGGVSITAITPTPQPSITSTVTQTVTPSPTATLTPTPVPLLPLKTSAGDWALANLIAWGAAFGFFWLGRREGTVRWAIRWSLLAAVGGLVAYLYLAIQFPGSQNWIEGGDKAGVLLATLIGSVVGWLGGVTWKSWISRRARMEKPPRRSS